MGRNPDADARPRISPSGNGEDDRGDLEDLLQELRVLLQGAQVLTTFLIMEDEMGSKNKLKIEKEMSRNEAVQKIQTLLDQLRTGAATVGDRAVTVPDQVRLQVEAEADELEIEIKWGTESSKEEEEEEETTTAAA